MSIINTLLGGCLDIKYNYLCPAQDRDFLNYSFFLEQVQFLLLQVSMGNTTTYSVHPGDP